MKVEQVSAYQMHEVTQAVYDYTHQWLDELPQANGYRDLRYISSSGKALDRENWVYSAFNFHIYFATHFFKARHVFNSNSTVGTDRLIAWLRHNPYLCLVDIGCGDGAASLALSLTLPNEENHLFSRF